MPDGSELIRAERQRQIDVEGWTPEHDDQHANAELVGAAHAYCWAAFCTVAFGANANDLAFIPNDFPKD